MDFSNYYPGQSALARIKQVRLVGVIGPTGVGKTTIMNAALARDPGLHLVASDTSRSPRPGENHGVDYYFRDKADLLSRIKKGEYVNVAPPLNGGDLYASHQDSYPLDGIGVMALFAEVLPYFRQLPFASFSSVYVIPSAYETWLARVHARDFTPEQLRVRLHEAARSLRFALRDSGMLFIVNDELDMAVQDFLQLPRQLQSDTAADQQKYGRHLAGHFLNMLSANRVA